MSQIPQELKYTDTHEWARVESDGSVTVGITDHAQELLGDVVFIELPEIDNDVNAAQETGVIESVKAASDLYAPVSGVITEVNDNLQDNPDLVNSDPYGEGWLYRLQPTDEDELEKLLDADAYAEQVASEGH